MSKSRTTTGLWTELFTFSIYKQSQGRLIRQLTFLAIVAIVAMGAWTWQQNWLSPGDPAVWLTLPWIIAAVGVWVGFRAVNHPAFADFLISVEGEMDKVSWASKKELYRAAVVVVVTMLLFSAILSIYDLMWYFILKVLGVLQI